MSLKGIGAGSCPSERGPLSEGHSSGQETIQPDNEMTRGKIAKIGFMLEVTEVQ